MIRKNEDMQIALVENFSYSKFWTFDQTVISKNARAITTNFIHDLASN